MRYILIFLSISFSVQVNASLACDDLKGQIANLNTEQAQDLYFYSMIRLSNNYREIKDPNGKWGRYVLTFHEEWKSVIAEEADWGELASYHSRHVDMLNTVNTGKVTVEQRSSFGAEYMNLKAQTKNEVMRLGNTLSAKRQSFISKGQDPVFDNIWQCIAIGAKSVASTAMRR